MADWTLNYSDREALRPALIPRIREAVRKYLLYVIGNGGNPSAERKEWCRVNMQNIAQLAEQVSQFCMSETAFIEGGTSISDAALSSRTEYVLQNYVGMPA